MEFTEIETPMMVRATPEGARDYLVPSRISSGSFYALPQSPQIYKQLCMVGGLDRYFQIARCMRDEDLRADRQPEFTQLDVEMSFVDEEDVYAVIERGLREAWAAAEFRGQPPDPFPRMAWRQAMEQYGSDKPDLRFGLQLHDLTDVARTSSFRVFAQAVERGGILKAIRVPGGTDLTRSDIEGRLLDVVKLHRARGLAYLWLRSDANAPMPADAEAAAASLAVGSATPGGTWDGQITKFLTAEELARIGAITGAEPGDCVLMVADRATVVHAALSALRAHLGRERRLYEPDAMAWLWVTDFPMFERDDETGAISPAHHPFTSPVFEDIPLLDSDPTRVRSRAYDIVVNGREIGSGSIRITDPVLQRRIFASLGIDEAGAEEKFGFLLEAFEYGVPPHGGFAAGIERLVMEGLGEESIRDVIAFPKNQQAQEVMTGAPAPVDAGQLADLGLSLRPPRPT